MRWLLIGRADGTAPQYPARFAASCRFWLAH